MEKCSWERNIFIISASSVSLSFIVTSLILGFWFDADASVWTILSSIGTILAGGGTVLLALVAVKAAKEWKKECTYKLLLDLCGEISIHKNHLQNVNLIQSQFEHFADFSSQGRVKLIPINESLEGLSIAKTSIANTISLVEEVSKIGISIRVVTADEYGVEIEEKAKDVLQCLNIVLDEIHRSNSKAWDRTLMNNLHSSNNELSNNIDIFIEHMKRF